MNQDAKNADIRIAMKTTRERHSRMDCRVFEAKVVSSKIPKSQKEQVNQYFREAKWRRNSIIADFENADRNGKTAVVKVGDTYEERELTILGSQVRQDIYDNVKSEIRGLHTKKKKGEKIGSLGFKPYCNCIPLRQYGVTYRINFPQNRIKIQNISKDFYVRGLKQIPEEAEITNTKFLRKPDGLYFHITCFVPKEEHVRTGKDCGMDFGIEHNLILSDETLIDINISESKGTKLASRRLNKSLKRNSYKKSANHYRRAKKLQSAYQKDRNRRTDRANKIVHNILTDYDFIAIQDEMIHNWHSSLFGKQVQHSAMGYIKAKLRNNSRVHVVERSFPSTQICPVCGCLTKHPLSEREYNCIHCGYHHVSRDIKSAQSILDEALRQVSAEHRAQSPVEDGSSALVSLDMGRKSLPMKQEAQVL